MVATQLLSSPTLKLGEPPALGPDVWYNPVPDGFQSDRHGRTQDNIKRAAAQNDFVPDILRPSYTNPTVENYPMKAHRLLCSMLAMLMVVGMPLEALAWGKGHRLIRLWAVARIPQWQRQLIGQQSLDRLCKEYTSLLRCQILGSIH